MKLGHVALDGAKVKANTSKRKTMGHKRMKEQAAQSAEEVAELPRRAQAVDVEDDSAHQVIVAVRSTNLTSDKQQAADMVEETLGNAGQSQRKCPTARAAARRRR